MSLFQEAQDLHDRITAELAALDPAKQEADLAKRRADLDAARDKAHEALVASAPSDRPMANIYTVAFVRYADSDDPYELLSDEGKKQQLAAEIQEAFLTGSIAGFFNVLDVRGATVAESDEVLGAGPRSTPEVPS